MDIDTKAAIAMACAMLLMLCVLGIAKLGGMP